MFLSEYFKFRELKLVILFLCLMLGGAFTLKCPPGITSFSADSGNTNYFRCVEGKAVLANCSSDSKYDRYSGECIPKGVVRKKRELSRGDITENDSLGRIVSLGTLYDARTDSIWNGFSLWSHEVIEAKKIVHKQRYSDLKISADRNFKDRASRFDLDASLQLSFMAGLIEVKGSAHYLKDNRETNEKIRVDMDYYAVTDSETIPQSTPVTFEGQCKHVGEKEGPTHVISSITHGLRAFFLFERTISNKSNEEEVGGSLSVSVKSIPSFKIEGSAVVDVEGKEIKNLDNVDVRFYGDVILDKTPTNYIDACRVFQQIPAKVDGTKSVVKFQMTPIKHYCGDTETILQQININMIVQATQILEDLSTLERHCNSLTSTTVSELFHSIRTTLNTFKEGLTKFSNNFKSDLATLLPKLKANTVDEGELVNLLNNYTSSPFNIEKARNFLGTREREVKSIDLVIKKAFDNENILVTDSKTANDNRCIFEKEFAITYIMYVLPEDDIAKHYIGGFEVDTGDNDWFNDNVKIGSAGEVFKRFISFANENKADNRCFLIQLERYHDSMDAIASISAMKNGVLITDNFAIPVVPSTPTCKDTGYDTIKLKTEITHNEDVNKYLATYIGLQPDGNWTESVSKYIPINSSISLTMLKPSTFYRIQLRHATVVGHSQPSDIVDCKTKPSSEPTVVRADFATQSSISLKWSAPKVIAPNLAHAYLISISKIDSGNEVILPDSGPIPNQEITLEHLEPSSLYNISVRFTNGEFEGPSSEVITVTTAPVPPPQLTLKKVANNYVTLVVDLRGIKVAERMKVLSFTLDYCKLDNPENINPVPGTTRTRTVVVETIDDPIETTLSDIAAGTTYSVKYKLTVSNVAGTTDTDYNNGVIFTTGYEKSDLEMFKESLGLTDIRSTISSQTAVITSMRASHADDMELLKSSFDNVVRMDSTGKIDQSLLPDNVVQEDSSGRISLSLLPDKVVQKDSSGRISLSLLPDKVVQKDSSGRISQSILPGSYASYTLEDIMWGSVHRAAVAACHRHGRHGAVVPITPGASCTTTCRRFSSGFSCRDVLDFKGNVRQITSYNSEVGGWYNGYTCSSTSSDTEVSKSEVHILGYEWLTYCCCTN